MNRPRPNLSSSFRACQTGRIGLLWAICYLRHVAGPCCLIFLLPWAVKTKLTPIRVRSVRLESRIVYFISTSRITSHHTITPCRTRSLTSAVIRFYPSPAFSTRTCQAHTVRSRDRYLVCALDTHTLVICYKAPSSHACHLDTYTARDTIRSAY